MSFTIVDDDIFNATEDYLCHQCNCVTTRSAHMAAAVFKKYPYSDIYSNRKGASEPGRVVVSGRAEKGQRLVINMLGQYYPGYSSSLTKEDKEDFDGYPARLKYFRSCLIEMSKLPAGSSFAFPWTIACGAAGGDWGKYITMLKGFEEYIDGDVVIYKLPPKKTKRRRK